MAIGIDCQLTVVFVVVKMSLVPKELKTFCQSLNVFSVLSETVFLSLELELLHVAKLTIS